MYSQATEAVSEPCKVCGGRASGTHFGVRACRACSAFYRRAITSNNQFECFKTCPNSRDDCKKCRLDRCHAAGMVPTANLRSQIANGSADSAASCSTSRATLLNRLLANYRELTRKRLAIEQQILDDCQRRRTPSLQLLQSDELNPFYFANFDLVNAIWRETAQESIQFWSDSFPEWQALEDQSKFKLFQFFIFQLYLSEGYYRAVYKFKRRPLESFFTTYSTALPFSKYNEYFDGTKMTTASVQVKDKFIELEVRCRDLVVPILDRLELSEIEFVASLILAVCSSCSETGCPDLANIGDDYTQRISQELHTIYRDEFKLKNYASTLGEMMTLTNALQMCASAMLSELQFLNFFEVFTKKSFAFSIVRKTKADQEPMF